VSARWPSVRLADVLHHRKEFVTIDDMTNYKRPRVQLHAKGVVLRDEVPGALIKTKQQQVCRAGEFLVAEIDAKVGGYGLVPDTLAGAIVSSHYFLFAVEETKLDRAFLDYFIRTPSFREQVEAQGSTNYAAIRPSQVMNYEMPLPSLSEQQRIVARIQDVAAQIEDARALRKQAADQAAALITSHLRGTVESLTGRHGSMRLEKLICEAAYGTSERCSSERDEGALPVLRIPNVASERMAIGQLKFARFSAGDAERYRLVEGDILVVRTNGSLDLVGRCAVVEELPEPMAFASYLIRLRLDPTKALPRYAQWMLRHLRVSGQLIDLARTTAGQYNVSLGRLRSATLPVPPLQEQRRIVSEFDALQDEVSAMKSLQAETAAELDALLPAILDRAFKGEL
jgi:type I restriction enzyme, S subunit